MLIWRCLSETSPFIMIAFKSCVKLEAQGPNVARHKFLCGPLFNLISCVIKYCFTNQIKAVLSVYCQITSMYKDVSHY